MVNVVNGISKVSSFNFFLPVHRKEFTGFAKWLGHFLTLKSFAVIKYNEFLYFFP